MLHKCRLALLWPGMLAVVCRSILPEPAKGEESAGLGGLGCTTYKVILVDEFSNIWLKICRSLGALSKKYDENQAACH